MEKQLPKTEKYLDRMEELIIKYCSDWEELELASDEDRAIFYNPMLHLAETIYMESPEWAEELTKYLCVLCGIKGIDIKADIK